MIKDMNIDLSQGFKSRLKHKDNEIAKVKKQIAHLQSQSVQGSAQRMPASPILVRPLTLEALTIEFESQGQVQVIGNRTNQRKSKRRERKDKGGHHPYLEQKKS